MTGNYQPFIMEKPDRVGDIAYNLANRREHLSHRAFALVENGKLGTVSSATKTGTSPSLNMVCTSQGAKWP